MGVCCKSVANRSVASGANFVRRRTEARIFLDFRVVHVLVTRKAGEAALKKTLALPQPDRVV